MTNPWEDIDLNSYEKHMSLGNVFQLQALNNMMKEQFYSYPIKSIMILGIAGGNGLEHIDKHIIEKVYGIDINKDYLNMSVIRYPELQDIYEPIQSDLTQETSNLPHADLLIANLFIEYIGYECFQKAVKEISPEYVSAIIQINTDTDFVSDSPYIHVFDRLDEVHHQMEENDLVIAMEHIGYIKIITKTENLPNGKKLIRIDFTKL